MDTWAPKQLKMMQVLSTPASLSLSLFAFLFYLARPRLTPGGGWVCCALSYSWAVTATSNGTWRSTECPPTPASSTNTTARFAGSTRTRSTAWPRYPAPPLLEALMFVRPRRAQQAAATVALTRNFCCFQGKPWQSPKQKPTFRSSQGGLGSLGSSGNSSQNSGSGSGSGSRGKKVPNLHPHAGFHRATA